MHSSPLNEVGTFNIRQVEPGSCVVSGDCHLSVKVVLVKVILEYRSLSEVPHFHEHHVITPGQLLDILDVVCVPFPELALNWTQIGRMPSSDDALSLVNFNIGKFSLWIQEPALMASLSVTPDCDNPTRELVFQGSPLFPELECVLHITGKRRGIVLGNRHIEFAGLEPRMMDKVGPDEPPKPGLAASADESRPAGGPVANLKPEELGAPRADGVGRGSRVDQTEDRPSRVLGRVNNDSDLIGGDVLALVESRLAVPAADDTPKQALKFGAGLLVLNVLNLAAPLDRKSVV